MKILIIGIVASGKTTFARRLSIESKISYYEIDLIVHDDIKGRKRTDEEQQKIIKKINASSSWIIEGTLRKNLYNLLEIADRIIYLDIPLKVRKRRLLLRAIKQKLKLEKCNYHSSIRMLKNMYKWTNNFEKNKDDFEKKLFKYGEKLVVLKSAKEISNYTLNLN